ncbi:MAG: tyrosine-type recombinase/integrase [Paludibacter sp.]|nr:tyrosine-type recombinase/integrase [Paludibacter sp.]
MSKKFSNTTADYLDWEQMLNLIHKLYKDEKYKISLLIALGCFWGLRISDLKSLKWEEILNVDEITIVEKKTNKKRVISVNPQLKQHILDCHMKINPIGFQHVFVSQKKGVFTTQRINVMLKEIKATYKLNIKNFSSHSLRKTFGRQVFNMSGENSEMALIKLMEIFNHSNMGITKRYLGLKDEEIKEAYDLLKF